MGHDLDPLWKTAMRTLVTYEKRFAAGVVLHANTSASRQEGGNVVQSIGDLPVSGPWALKTTPVAFSLEDNS